MAGMAFIVAAELKKLGAEVQAILCFGIPKGRTAREAYEKAYAAEVPMVDLAISPYGCELAMSGVDIVVDAILGLVSTASCLPGPGLPAR